MRYDIAGIAGSYLPALAGREVVEVIETGAHWVEIDGERHDLPPAPQGHDAAARQLVAELRRIAGAMKPQEVR